MRQVPTYSLYGEPADQDSSDFLHCETIESRSRLHDYRIRPHRHERLFQMLFLADGEGEFACDGSQSTLVPPCLVMVPALAVHGYAFSNTVRGLVLTLYQHQAEAILDASPDALRSLAVPRAVALGDRPHDAAAIESSLAAVAREFEERAPDRAGMMAAHLAVTWLTAHRADRTPPAWHGPGPPRGALHIGRFRQMVDREYRSRAPVEQYARALGITQVHLRRLCREHLGATPLGALNARVVLEARRLLEFTALSVKEVAAEIGFPDEAYFSRFFRRETGLAPGAFRANSFRADAFRADAFRARRQTTALPRTSETSPHSGETRPASAPTTAGRSG